MEKNLIRIFVILFFISLIIFGINQITIFAQSFEWIATNKILSWQEKRIENTSLPTDWQFVSTYTTEDFDTENWNFEIANISTDLTFNETLVYNLDHLKEISNNPMIKYKSFPLLKDKNYTINFFAKPTLNFVGIDPLNAFSIGVKSWDEVNNETDNFNSIATFNNFEIWNIDDNLNVYWSDIGNDWKNITIENINFPPNAVKASIFFYPEDFDYEGSVAIGEVRVLVIG